MTERGNGGGAMPEVITPRQAVSTGGEYRPGYMVMTHKQKDNHSGEEMHGVSLAVVFFPRYG